MGTRFKYGQEQPRCCGARPRPRFPNRFPNYRNVPKRSLIVIKFNIVHEARQQHVDMRCHTFTQILVPRLGQTCRRVRDVTIRPHAATRHLLRKRRAPGDVATNNK